MAANDFLPVATGGGANVESQATYATDPVVPLGFGINAVAGSALWNKMMRQSSFVISCLAGLIATNLGLHAADDGVAANLTVQLNQLFPPGTGGQLQRFDATHLILAPVNGGMLWINGANYPIPAALKLSNAGMAASATLYYIYAYMNAGVMMLEYSATGYTPASNGIPQKSGDVTRTLVGSVYTDATPNFNDSATKRNVASYFNRRNRDLNGPTTPATIFSNTSAAEIATSARVEAMTWGDEASFISGVGSIAFDTAHSICGSLLGVSTNGGGFTNPSYGVTATATNAGDEYGSGFGYAGTFAEGHQIFTPYAIIDGGTSDCAISVGIQGLIRS